MKQPIAFCTHVSDDWYHSIGAHKLIQSAKYFHPEIPFYRFGTQQINELFAIHPKIDWNTLNPFVSYQLIDEYDMVVHFDADSMIVGKLDELLNINGDFDIIGVRNNNDYNKAGKDNFITQGNLNPQNYLNAGLVGTNSKRFLEEWMNRNITEADRYPFQEQSVLNDMTIKYPYKILDPRESNVYYGISGLYGTETHWDSWKEITLNENKELILNSKKVKVLHHGGGHNADKLDFNLFSEEVKQRLNEITN